MSQMSFNNTKKKTKVLVLKIVDYKTKLMKTGMGNVFYYINLRNLHA